MTLGAVCRSRTVGAVGALALVAAMLLLAPGRAFAAGGGCAPILDSVFVESISVYGKAEKRRYRPGQTLVIDVTATRPGREDPAGAGIPLDGTAATPAAEAFVGVGVYVGDSFLFGHGITDANGRAKVPVKIYRDTPAGVAEVETYAWKLIANYTCGSAFEFGYNIDLEAFRVVKGKRR